MKKQQFVLVDRLDFSSTSHTQQQIEQCIAEGRSIMIFAEGTFSRTRGVRPFKLGAFELSAKTGAGIVPIGINGARDIFTQFGWLLKPAKVTLTVGETIQPQGCQWDEIIRLRKLTREAVMQLSGEHYLNLIQATPVNSTKD